MNIEEASPADFIPLPAGAQDRRIWIGKFGDVEGLLDSGRIEFDRLRRYYEEVLPRCGRESLRQDPDRHRRHFEALEARRKGPQGGIEPRGAPTAVCTS